MLPAMRERGSGRIVRVTSVRGAVGQPFSDAYLARAAGSFANAQSAEDAARTVVEAATTETPRFRWQTSDAAVAFAGLSLADLDGTRVLGATTSWLA